MDRAFDRAGNLIPASKANKYIEGYTCPCCGNEVIKAGGTSQRDHFRHKVGGSQKYCDLYTQGLGSSYDSSDYATVVRIPYIILEETESEWEFYLKFPKIQRGYTRLFEDKELYFNVTCIEMQKGLHSLNLRHDSVTNKLRINPKISYQISIDNREHADRLDLRWPEKITGFERDTYIFSYLNGEFVKMERKEIFLHETFYLVSKKKIFTFPKMLTVQPLKSKENWHAYKIILPDTLNDHLINWFYDNFKYKLQPAYYYLDLLAPSLYGRHDFAYAIEQSTCTIALTFREFKHSNPVLVHLDAAMKSQEYTILSYVKEFFALEHGFHTFYLKGHEGKMLTLYVDNKRDNTQKISYASSIIVDERKAFIFENKVMQKRNTREVFHDIPFKLWCKEKRGFPFPVNGKDYELKSDETIIYIPSVWSIKIRGKSRENQKHGWNVSNLLHSYMKLDCIQNVLITNKQYKELLKVVELLPNSIEKQKLTYFVKLYRNRAPRIVEEIFKNI